MTLEGRTHYNAIICIMDYSMTSPARGLVLKPHGNWDRINTDYEFEVTVKTYSDYAKCPDMRRSITGSAVHLNRALVIFRSSTQKMVSLSTTKAELNAAVKDALFVKNILKSPGL